MVTHTQSYSANLDHLPNCFDFFADRAMKLFAQRQFSVKRKIAISSIVLIAAHPLELRKDDFGESGAGLGLEMDH